MAFDLGSLLQQYLGGNAPSAQAADHFDQAAQSAPPNVLSSGIAGMFRSDATPPFGQLAGQLFGNANPNQQAGMLNSLIAGMGPTVLASLLNRGGAASGGLGGLLGSLTGGSGSGSTPPALTPAQASQLTPDQVQVIATHAEQANPGIVDQMSEFYAQHPGLVKTVGSAALAVVLAKMAERNNG